MLVSEQWLESGLLGGAILGGGGGGSMDEGRELGRLALELGFPEVLPLEELPNEALILTVSAVGAPSGERQTAPSYYVRAAEIILDYYPDKISGLIPNEIGGLAAANGLLQSAMLGIPVVDAACNGRAHPVSTMGSLGLSLDPKFVSHQSAVGGFKNQGTYVEIYVTGSLRAASSVIRKTAEIAGGLVAGARNPVPARFVKENAAVGALSETVQLGEAYLAGSTAGEKIDNVISTLRGTVITQERVDSIKLVSRGGFDVGEVRTQGHELAFWNEYMTLDRKGERLATFPDLIMTMDTSTGRPVATSEIQQGQKITVIIVPKRDLNLGAGMRDRTLFQEVEKVLGKEILRFAFPLQGETFPE